jgi:MFS family permease
MNEKRFFANRWWIVFGSTIAMIVGGAVINTFTFGLFIKPITAEFGWTRGMITAANGAALMATAIMVPVIGAMIDRWGIRRVMLPVLFLFALALVLLALSPASLLIFTILYAFKGATSAGQSPIAYAKSISSRFDRQRGLALGIAMAGTGIGAALVPQFAQYMIGMFGWRYAHVGLAALLLVLAVPSVLLFIPEPLRLKASQDRATRANDAELGASIREILSSAKFWVLFVSTLLVSIAINGSIVHIVPLLTDKGMAPSAAASLLIAVGLSTMAGRLVSGYFMDRFFAPYVSAVVFFIACVGEYLLGSAHLPLLGVIAIGFASGSEVDMIGFMISRYFGLLRYGQCYGYVFSAYMIGSAVGPYLMGICFDKFGSYDFSLIAFGGALIAGGALLLFLGPYKYPARKGHGTESPALAPSAGSGASSGA